MYVNDTSVCLLTKDSIYCDIAINFVRQNFLNYKIVKGDLNDSQNKILYETKFDYIIAFLYPKIVTEDILKNAVISAINFHPGPPEYPGAGCYSFALYNDEKSFGTTCHHMLKKPDTGQIILVKRFPIFKNDIFNTLKERTMIYTLLNFFELMYIIIEKKDLPISKERWKREPNTRKDFNRLLEITLDTHPDEIDRRIRATAHPQYPGPFIQIGGKKYTIRY